MLISLHSLMKGDTAMKEMPKPIEIFTEEDKKFNQEMVKNGEKYRKELPTVKKEDDIFVETLKKFYEKWGMDWEDKFL